MKRSKWSEPLLLSFLFSTAAAAAMNSKEEKEVVVVESLKWQAQRFCCSILFEEEEEEEDSWAEKVKDDLGKRSWTKRVKRGQFETETHTHFCLTLQAKEREECFPYFLLKREINLLIYILLMCWFGSFLLLLLLLLLLLCNKEV